MPTNTDWEESASWYDSLVGEEGHYYHQNVILPKLLPLLDLDASSSILDLGCGQAILAKHIPKNVLYLGVDLSPSLISAAKKKADKNHKFLVADICKPLKLGNEKFTHVTFLLSIQNIEFPSLALKNASDALEKGGILCMVMNHPCFRIPRQSGWGVDKEKKLQYRRIDRYLTPLKIPIKTHPGKQRSNKTTLSFHHSLSDYSKFLEETHFSILKLEEWISNKKSSGPMAKMEDRARQEFPLFLAIKAEKRS